MDATEQHLEENYRQALENARALLADVTRLGKAHDQALSRLRLIRTARLAKQLWNADDAYREAQRAANTARLELELYRMLERPRGLSLV